jgi:beta-N-acetylglucosaminidase
MTLFQHKHVRINLKRIAIGVLTALVVSANGFLGYKVMTMQEEIKEVASIKEEIKDSREANEHVLVMLKEIRNEQARQADAMQINQEKKMKQENAIKTLKQTGFTVYTDLGTSSTGITVEDMDRIIAYYDAVAFEGHGDAFIQASAETGLSPIYLFAHAAAESGFGTSYLARNRHNYYGIAAFDNDPNAAYSMGDSVDEGIINGAKWIKKHYYDDGDTNLAEMHETYASDPNWANQISGIANKAIDVL